MANLWMAAVRWLRRPFRVSCTAESDVPQEARAVIDDLRNSLIAMAVDPPFRFLNTSKSDAEACLQRMNTFRGFSEQEIARAEKRLGFRFPTMFRAYLPTVRAVTTSRSKAIV